MATFAWMQPGCPGIPIESACDNLSADADEDANGERQIIEDARAGSRGRVSCTNGAAARVPSTAFDPGAAH
jgi:hypothetical protein